MQFQKITQADPSYAALKAQLSTLNDRFDYDGLAAFYATCSIGDVIPFEYPKGKASILGKNLERRGLSRNQDFTLESALVKETVNGEQKEINKVFLTRLTDKAPQQVTVKPGRKKSEAAAGDGAAAASTEAAAASTEAAGKGKGKK